MALSDTMRLARCSPWGSPHSMAKVLPGWTLGSSVRMAHWHGCHAFLDAVKNHDVVQAIGDNGFYGAVLLLLHFVWKGQTAPGKTTQDHLYSIFEKQGHLKGFKSPPQSSLLCLHHNIFMAKSQLPYLLHAPTNVSPSLLFLFESSNCTLPLPRKGLFPKRWEAGGCGTALCQAHSSVFLSPSLRGQSSFDSQPTQEY